MSHMSYMNPRKQIPEMVSAFGGYDHNIEIPDGSFYDMKNMTSDKSPIAASRDRRGYPDIDVDGEILSVVAKEKLIVSYKSPKYVVYKNGVPYAALKYKKDPDFIPLASSPTHIEAQTHETLAEGYGECANFKEYSKDVDTPWQLTDTPVAVTNTKLLWAIPNVEKSIGDRQGIFFSSITNFSEQTDDYKCTVTANAIMHHSISSEDIENFVGQNMYLVLSYLSVNTRRYFYFDKKLKIKAIENVSDTENKTFTVRFYKDEIETEDIKINGTEYSIKTAVSNISTIKSLISDTEGVSTSTISLCGVLSVGGEDGYSEHLPAITEEEIPTLPDSLCVCEYDPATETARYNTEICDFVDGKHYIVEMGAYIELFPEKVQVNTLKIENGLYSEIKPLETDFKPENVMQYARLTTLDGEILTVKWTGKAPPQIKSTTNTTTTKNVSQQQIATESATVEAKSNGSYSSISQYDVWIDTSNETPVVKRWSDQQGAWATIQAYLTIMCERKHPFEKGDAIEIVFADDEEIDGETIHGLKSVIKLADEQKYFVIAKTGEIMYSGLTQYFYRVPVNPTGWFASSTVWNAVINKTEAKRSLPVMDFVIESQNRLWGCRYGDDGAGNIVNEIFASKLADASNWHYFANTSVDSYYVSLGSDGAFTGAVNYQNHPTFFKSDCIHRITGNYPAQYQLDTISCYGVSPDSPDSVCVMNDVVYYHSYVGMLAYANGLPQSVSAPFGAEKYHGVICGTVGNKLYASMLDKNENKVLFVLDDSKVCWHKEDDLDAKLFCSYGNECFAVTSDDVLVSLYGIYGTEKEEAVEWMLQTGNIGYSSPYHKRLLKVLLRIKLILSGLAVIEVQYDDDGVWRMINEFRPNGYYDSFAFPFTPTRCDHFSIRVRGKGDFELLTATKFYTEGSDSH